jgi:hypothetical protein
MGGTDPHIIDAGIEAHPDGWYRVWVTYNIDAGAGKPWFYFELDQMNTLNPYYAGDGVSGVYLSQPRIEKGSGLPSPLESFGARMILGELDSDGQYRSKQIAPFTVREAISGSNRSYASDVFRFVLDSAASTVSGPMPARVQATIENRAIDLNMTCWF